MVTATGIYDGLHTKVNKRKEDIVSLKKLNMKEKSRKYKNQKSQQKKADLK